MRIFKFFAALYLFVTVLGIINSSTVKAQGRISFQTFYDELEPYGRWYNDRQYGYVWAPSGDQDFQPYSTGGRWVVTEYGNTWVSDYPWGWAPFHYGRWEFDNYNGWFWIPDYEWAPAWVAWRSGRGHYGWAPLGYGMDHNIAINIPVQRWIFVPERYIMHYRVYDYCVRRPQLVHIYRGTRYIDNYYDRENRRYVCGPRTYDIERATRSRVVVHRIYDDNRPGRSRIDKRTVRIYRPEVNRNSSERSRPSRETTLRTRDNNHREKDDRKNGNVSAAGNDNRDIASSRPSRDNEPGRAENDKATVRASTRSDNPVVIPDTDAARPSRNDNESSEQRQSRERISAQPTPNPVSEKPQARPKPSESRRPQRQAEPVQVRERQESRPKEGGQQRQEQPRQEHSGNREQGGRPRR